MRLSPKTRKRLLLGLGIFVGLFVVSNIVLALIYHNRTYPHTKVMHTTIGSVSYSKLAATLDAKNVLGDSLVVGHDTTKVTVSSADLGITKDLERTTKSADKQRSWLPLVNVFRAPELQAPVHIDSATLARAADNLKNAIHKEASNAHLQLTGDKVAIVEAKNGYALQTEALKASIYAALDKGQKTVDAPVTALKPTTYAASLKDKKSDLEAQLKTSISFTYKGKTKQAASNDIASWYVASSNGGYDIAPDKIAAYVATTGSGFGIRVKDINQVAGSVANALAKHQNLQAPLSEQVALKTFTYCTAVRGVDASYLPAFKAKAVETYGSDKGWSVGGLVAFKEVSSGCDYTLWLTAASQMPTFGEICDSQWSCRIGPNVVINFDRWQNASPAWNAAGLSLEVYRNMAINHETGHWLGFDHSGCPGAGQPAPVMEQQSIDLQGCTFNAWPTAKEITTFRNRIGV